MSVYTCNNCNYTFQAPEAVDSCPDCGKSVATRCGGRTCSPVPAIRPATEAELAWFRRVQAELAETDWWSGQDERAEALRSARRAG